MLRYTRHLWIPDTQVREGVPTKHIEALGNYIAEKQFEKIIVAGDWFDCPATSVHNSPREQEGLRILDDIQSGKRAMNLLWKPVNDYNKRRKNKYLPQKHFFMGNHEYHLERFVDKNPVLEGMIDYSLLGLEEHGFKVHPFLKPVDIDGILYCHFFVQPMSGRPVSGMMETRLKTIAQSFTQGHAQSFAYGEREVASGKRHHGLVAGAFYMHDEAYKGPQGNNHWRGVVVKNEVRDGTYDLCKVSLDFLLRKYL